MVLFLKSFLSMRKFWIIILCACYLTSTTVLGQTDPLDDFWKDVERRKSVKKTELQDVTTKFESKILSSWGAKIFILQQDYLYEKKNVRYVRGNDDYYERAYGIGIAINEGIVTSNHLFQPWNHDNSLLPSKGYSPVLTNVEIKSLTDTLFIKKEEGKYEIHTSDGLARYPFNKQESNGSGIVEPDSFGLLMIFYHETLSDSFITKIVEYKPKWVEGMAAIDTQLLSKEIIGGLFFNMDTSQGKSDIFITAIISGDVESEFKLVGLSDHLSSKPTDKTKERSDPKKTKGNDGKSHSSGNGKMEKD